MSAEDYFNAWQRQHGELVTDQVDGEEVVRSSTSARAFAAEHARVNAAIDFGGWVIELGDGFAGLHPDCPPELAAYYRRLLSAGYALGFLP